MQDRSYRLPSAVIVLLLLGGCAATGDSGQPPRDAIIISVLGTNDVHGQLLASGESGGVAAFSAYVAALRAARQRDGGVLLIDAGDMWQGTLESNLGEGAVMVEAYNTLGYDAAAIGNHEFDFGPVGPKAVPESSADDPRGALKQRALEAEFPLLAANLVDETTGKRVDWPNVPASLMTEVNGVSVGIIGAITTSAPATTIAANIAGLRVEPLATAIIREARRLRDAGAVLVIVTAHAGSRCERFDDPANLDSCNMQGEIMRVAAALPVGLVDHIIAGHVHAGIAHEVNDIAITASFSKLRAFGRVDFTIEGKHVVERRIFPPQPIAANPAGVQYEGVAATPMPAIAAILAEASEATRHLKNERLGVHLQTPITLDGNPESPLGNMMTDALRDMLDVDVVIHNVSGGIRAPLPAGDLTYGAVFEMFPFDNRIVILDLSGAGLRRIVAAQVAAPRRSAGISGLRVFARCDEGSLQVKMQLQDGRIIGDEDRLRVGVNDFLATSGDGILAPAMPAGGYDYADDPRLTRDVVADWLRQRGGQLHASDFDSSGAPRWNLPDELPATCRFQD